VSWLFGHLSVDAAALASLAFGPVISVTARLIASFQFSLEKISEQCFVILGERRLAAVVQRFAMIPYARSRLTRIAPAFGLLFSALLMVLTKKAPPLLSFRLRSPPES
jgi:hypothetical protein